MGFGDLITVISIGVTIFVAWKLYTVLGQRTGHQAPPPLPRQRPDNSTAKDVSNDNVIDLPVTRGERPSGEVAQGLRDEALKKHAEPDTALYNSLKILMDADRSFNPDQFLNGARMAYEMVVTAFADGDTKTLKNLLAKDVFDGFSGAISERKARGERMEFSFVGINQSKILNGELVKSDEFITVRFVSQIISATLDAEGKVIAGDSVEISEVTDIWTFARDLRSRDPNWKLVATEADE